MLGTENYEKIKFKTTSNNGITSREEIDNQKVLMGEIDGATQEMGEKKLQYGDHHDDPSRLRD